MSLVSVVPYGAPKDAELAERVRLIAQQVYQVGHHIESSLLVTPQGEFLQDHTCDAYRYYTWILYALKEGISLERLADLERLHVNRIAPIGRRGGLKLTSSDQFDLLLKLQTNTGSKESIKAIRKWVLDRAHSIICISSMIKDYVDKVVTSCAASGVNNITMVFDKVLYTLYAVNDILFNSKDVSSIGVYTSLISIESDSNVDIAGCIFLYLPFIMYLARSIANSDEQLQKLKKLIALWRSKVFIEESRCQVLENILSSPSSTPPIVDLGGIILESPEVDIQLLHEFKATQISFQPIPPPPPPRPPGSYFPPIPRPPQYPQQLPVSISNTNVNSGITSHVPGFDQQTSHMHYPPVNMSPHIPLNIPPMPPMPPIQYPMVYAQQPPIPMASAVPFALPTSDLYSTISVGILANVMKAAIKSGHPKYYPLDMLSIPQAVAAHVEPGRLEIRLNEFYRKKEEIDNPVLNSNNKKRLSGDEEDRDYYGDSRKYPRY